MNRGLDREQKGVSQDGYSDSYSLMRIFVDSRQKSTPKSRRVGTESRIIASSIYSYYLCKFINVAHWH